MESEFVGVFGSYNRLIYEDLKEIDNTLNQIADLTSDADNQIYNGLDKVGQLFDRHNQQLLEAARKNGVTDTAVLEQLMSESQVEFVTEKNQILRSMQATDMVSQLLGHCRTRMNRIRKMSNEIERVTEARMEAFAGMVQEMKALLEDTQLKLDTEMNKAVEQITVDEGEIQFF